ncbi:MAG: nitroreductase family protein [Macellibacteroides fermentans]|uniref:nitroreductase family protein n=1 Tax=Macellibacteroides fermentans TaxID=879969 RepID=UPI003AC80398
MRDFLSLALQRQSDRAFDATRPVEKEKLERMLEAARMAPSACNAQPWHFIVVDDPELKNQVADATSSKLIGINHFTKQAPVHIIVVEESVNLSSGFGSLVKDKKFAHVDIGITAAHLCLAAEDEGLGTCIIGWFNESKVRKLLNIPSGKRVLLDIVVGYSLQPDRPKKRKEKDKVISFNSYK